MKRSVLVLASLALLLWGGSWMTACGAAGSGAGNAWLDRVLWDPLLNSAEFLGSTYCNSTGADSATVRNLHWNMKSSVERIPGSSD